MDFSDGKQGCTVQSPSLIRGRTMPACGSSVTLLHPRTASLLSATVCNGRLVLDGTVVSMAALVYAGMIRRTGPGEAFYNCYHDKG